MIQYTEMMFSQVYEKWAIVQLISGQYLKDKGKYE